MTWLDATAALALGCIVVTAVRLLRELRGQRWQQGMGTR